MEYRVRVGKRNSGGEGLYLIEVIRKETEECVWDECCIEGLFKALERKKELLEEYNRVHV